MKKIILLIIVITTIHITKGQANKPFTLMIYMNGTSGLEHQALLDFIEMTKVQTSDSFNVYVQLSREKNNSTSNGDWKGIKRFKLAKGLKPIAKHAIGNVTDLSMADPKTLTNFIQWCRNLEPTGTYGLIFWDHGNLWKLNMIERNDTEIYESKAQSFYKELIESIEKSNFTHGQYKKEALKELRTSQKVIEKKLKKQLRYINAQSLEIEQLIGIDLPKITKNNTQEYFSELHSIDTLDVPFIGSAAIDKIAYLKQIEHNFQQSIDSFLAYSERKQVIDNNYKASLMTPPPFSNFKDQLPIINVISPIIIDGNGNKANFLSIDDISKVIKTDRFELIAFDSCIMGNIEVALSLKNISKYMVASQETISGHGFNYSNLLKNTDKQERKDFRIISQSWVDLYADDYRSSRTKTLSAANLNGMDEFAEQFEHWCDELLIQLKSQSRTISQYWNSLIIQSRLACKVYGSTDQEDGISIDLVNFLEELILRIDQEAYKAIYDDTVSLIAFIKKDIVINAFPKRDSRAHRNLKSNGLSIYFPKSIATHRQYVLTTENIDQFIWHKILSTINFNTNQL
tara:strand:- start:141 stop:1853 length:1713 start_codon:yes stop_codon:yes gene_type:complete